MPSQGVPLGSGETLILTTEQITAVAPGPNTPGRVPVQYQHLPEAVKPGNRILIDDGLIELKVIAVEGKEITTEVTVGGFLMSNKGLNLPHASLSIPAITERDRENLKFALDQQVDWIAMSFVRTAQEVLEMKAMIREFSTLGRSTPVIAKIEKPEAVDNIDAIIEVVDAIMVARGDLGIETATELVPIVQKTIIRKCNEAGKPVITATQMLDSMIRNPRPTRAEASDVANAIIDGSDAIMLSGETAAGKYPVLAVETMSRIVCETEMALANAPGRQIASRPGRSFAEAVAHATVSTALDLKAAAIICPTVSGDTALAIARFRPHCPIVAVTPSLITQRQLMLVWGVEPVMSTRYHTTDEVISDAVDTAHKRGYIDEGDIAIITGGEIGYGLGTTNMMKVHLLERVLAHGTGLGERRIMGRLRHLVPPFSPDTKVDPDEIIVTPCTDRMFVPILRRAAGLVTSDNNPDSHCRLLALEMGIPAVVGISEGLEALQDGTEVVLDAKRGLVYERPRSLLRPVD
jgi:pyruvate kinase